MPINYPTSLDAFTNPAGTDPTTNPDHAAQHANVNDAVEQLETKLGTGASTPTTTGHVLTVTGPGATGYQALGSVASGKRFATRVVAASNAHADSKAAADYVCDGVADQVEINAAIADLPANIGGRVLLTEGTFFDSAEVVIEKTGVMLQGVGMSQPDTFSKRGGTRIKAVSGFSSAQILRVSAGSNTANQTHVYLRDFGVDGDLVGTVHGIYWRAQWSRIENVSAWDCGGDGFRIEGFTGSQTLDCTYYSLNARNNTGYGMNFVNFGGDGQVLASTISSNGTGGVYCGGSSVQWVNCHFYSNTGYNFYVPSGAARVKIIGSKFEHATLDGIFIEGSQAIVEGCSLQGNGDTGEAECAIRISGTQALISGNQIIQETGDSSLSADTGIILTSTASTCFIVGNRLSGFTTMVSNAGSGNQARANFGLADFG